MPFFSLPSGASPVLAGSSPPTGGVGQVGDLFIDTVNATLYGPKTISGWATGINLSLGPTGPASTVAGPTGPTGPRVTGPAGPASTVTGPTGPSGVAGQPGATGGYAFAATGATAPNLVTPGAIWLDTSSGRYYVRYESQFIEIGVQGERGVTGPPGSGPTGPAGSASTVTGPTGPASTLAGPTGPAGVAGNNGSAGPTGPASTVPGPTGPTGPRVTGPSGPAGVFPFSATGATAPAGVVQGAVWLDTSSGRYYVRYETQFIEIGVQGERGPTGSGGAGPTGGYGLPQEINARTDTYTLVAADAGRLVTIDSGSEKSVIIPPASSVAFATGTHIDVARLGNGAVTVTGGAGVTINATPGQKLRARYSGASLVLYAGDTWLVVGDLSS